MRIKIGINDARLLQNGNRKRTADVAGRTITRAIDLLAEASTFICAGADIFERGFINPDLFP